MPAALSLARVSAYALLLHLAAAAPARAADPPPEAYDGGLFDVVAHAGFWFNRQVFAVINTAGDWLRNDPAPVPSATLGAPQTAFDRGAANMLANLVNEPITAAANLMIGDFSTAWQAVQRFAINSTVGLLGWRDEAKDWGIPPMVSDVGLVLCSAGVGEGAYVVLPFIGPRTVRDGASDIVLTNLVLWPLTALVLGTGATLQTIVIAESIEVLAELTAVRQIDPNAKINHFNDFNGVRAAYLEQRRDRCARLRREQSAVATSDIQVHH